MCFSASGSVLPSKCAKNGTWLVRFGTSSAVMRSPDSSREVIHAVLAAAAYAFADDMPCASMRAISSSELLRMLAPRIANDGVEPVSESIPSRP